MIFKRAVLITFGVSLDSITTGYAMAFTAHNRYKEYKGRWEITRNLTMSDIEIGAESVPEDAETQSDTTTLHDGHVESTPFLNEDRVDNKDMVRR